MAPLTPHWERPSHPEIQEVVINEAEFTSKSLSKISLPPFGIYAKMDFPPCTAADEPTYATVQMGRNKHLNLNSDLLYINHSCEPSLIFDTGNLNIIAGPKGLQKGEELTFFYPSTEWYMAQPFDCLCGKPTCRGRISGARDMTKAQLEGAWLNGHILELLGEQEQSKANTKLSGNGSSVAKSAALTDDPTAQALKDALRHAEKVVEAAKAALNIYISNANSGSNTSGVPSARSVHPITSEVAAAAATTAKIPSSSTNFGGKSIDTAATALNGIVDDERHTAGSSRRGPTSRELSGEMGGDTKTRTA